MKIKIIIILITLSLLFPAFTLADDISVKIISISPGQPKIVTIPGNITSVKFDIKTISSTPAEKPEMKFAPTNKNNSSSTGLIHEEPYQYEIYKKGENYDIRLFVPEYYYKSGKYIKNGKAEVTITYEEPTKTKSLYETQAPDIDYLIITTSTYYPTFNNNFSSWKISNSDISSIEIINLSSITSNSTFWVNGTYGDASSASNPYITPAKAISSNYNLFNDTQAKIRNCLRYYHSQYNLKYVLIGGNKNIIPPRMVASRASGDGCTSFDNDLSHASDLYYACLDYSQNNNTNSYFMENQCCEFEYDEVDYGIELHVGRFLFSTQTELDRMITKTKNYVQNQNNSYKYQIVACKDASNNIANQTWTGWDGSSFTGVELQDEFPSNMTFINGQNITQSQWDNIPDYVNGNIGTISGINTIYHTGHGGTLWDDYRQIPCSNSEYPNFLYTEGCSSGDFGTDTTSRAEYWMSDEGCTVACIVNSAYGWFIASTYFGEEMMSIMFNTTRGTLNTTFLEAHNYARELQGTSTANGVWAMIYKESNFFGDPALDYKFYQETWETWELGNPPTILSIDYFSNQSTSYNKTPPLNWTVVPNASEYRLQLATDSSFSNIVVDIADINAMNYPSYYSQNETRVTFILPPEYQLENLDDYYMRVSTNERDD